MVGGGVLVLWCSIPVRNAVVLVYHAKLFTDKVKRRG
jgi:hypothetical protein